MDPRQAIEPLVAASAASVSVPALRIAPGGPARWDRQAIAEEVPVTVRYNEIPYAVMMASPCDLGDFGLGFTLTERIAATAADIRAVVVGAAPDVGPAGMTVDITLTPPALRAHLASARARVGKTHASCGLCGVTDAALALALAPPVTAAGRLVAPSAIQAALAALEAAQSLNRITHATHGAGWADPAGHLLLIREDVGRHTALDKLIGAGMSRGVDLSNGLCVITSRCSVEMVQKAILAGMPLLAAISAPTALAVRVAEAAGLTLVGFARGGAMSVYAGAWRLGA